MLNNAKLAAPHLRNLDHIIDPYWYLNRRVTTWQEGNDFGIHGKIYWGSSNLPVAFRAINGQTYFEHQDWLGTERLNTNYAGAVAGSFISLPFGDGFSVSGTDGDPYHFAQFDKDYYGSADSQTDHAQFRQYDDAQGRWMSPDPYSGSYHFFNPQSFNRYSYALNNPLSHVDPLGLEDIPSCPEVARRITGVHAMDEGGYCDGGGGDGSGGDGGSTGDPGGDPTSAPFTFEVTAWGMGITELFDLSISDFGLFDPSLMFQPLALFGGGASNAPCSITVKCRGIQTKDLGKLGFQHCDAQITDSSGATHSDSGGPMNYQGQPIQLLNAWDTSPPTEPFTGTTVYQGKSCSTSGCVINSTQKWHQDPIKPLYDPVFGPNSNTWLKQTFSGCGVSLPINTWGSIL